MFDYNVIRQSGVFDCTIRQSAVRAGTDCIESNEELKNMIPNTPTARTKSRSELEEIDS